MNEIFLSYRRAEHPALIGRIYDRLISDYGQESVFLDVDSIPLGIDFEQHLKDQVSKCTVFVAVIGAEWLKRTDRLFRKDDFIRIELDWAIRFGKPIIPLLVGVEMPSVHSLPEELQSFSGRNGMVLDPGHDFHIHMARLVKEIGRSIMPDRIAHGDVVHPNFKTISQVVMNVVDEIQYMLEQPGAVSGIASGFADLDLLTNGFEPAGFYVFATEPSLSATSLLNSIVQRILKPNLTSILWIDTDSNEETVGLRLICSIAAVDTVDLRRGLLSARQQDGLASAVRSLQKAQISIITVAQGVRSVLAEVFRQDRGQRPDIIIVDDLSSIGEVGKEEIVEIARFAKLARIPLLCSLRVPLNRSARSAMEMFKQSAFAQEIFQSASFISWLSIYEDYEPDPDDSLAFLPYQLSVIMNKRGETGDIQLNYWPQYMTFSAEHETTLQSWNSITKSREDSKS